MTEWDALGDWLEEQSRPEWAALVRAEHCRPPTGCGLACSSATGGPCRTAAHVCGKRKGHLGFHDWACGPDPAAWIPRSLIDAATATGPGGPA